MAHARSPSIPPIMLPTTPCGACLIPEPKQPYIIKPCTPAQTPAAMFVCAAPPAAGLDVRPQPPLTKGGHVYLGSSQGASRTHARELPPRSLDAGKPLPLGVEPESPRPHRGDRHQNCARSRVRLGLGRNKTGMHGTHWADLICNETLTDGTTHTTGTLAHAPYPMSAPSPGFALVYHTSQSFARSLLCMCRTGNTASMQPHLIAVRGCRGQDNAVLVLSRARAAPVQQERGQAQHDRQHHRRGYDRRHDDGAARRAAGRRRRRCLPGACPGEEAKVRVSSKSGFAHEHHCQSGQGAKVAS